MRIFTNAEAESLQMAVRQDSSIETTLEKLSGAPGVSTQYMLELGVTKALLRKCEVWGLAKRGYTQDKDGRKVRWVLICPTEAVDGRVDEQKEGASQ